MPGYKSIEQIRAEKLEQQSKLIEKLTADLDYLSMMSGVELETVNVKEATTSES